MGQDLKRAAGIKNLGEKLQEMDQTGFVQVFLGTLDSIQIAQNLSPERMCQGLQQRH